MTSMPASEPALSKQAASPRLAVIGCGYWGKNLVRNFAALGALEALVDSDKATVEALRQQFGGRHLSFDEALADPGDRGRRHRGSRGASSSPCPRGASARQARLRGEAARARHSRGRGAVRARRAPRPAPDGRASASISSGLPRAQAPRARGQARPPSICGLQPPQSRQDPPRGGHPVVVCSARYLDDPVARGSGALASERGGRLRAAPVHRRRDDDASRFPGRRAGACVRFLAPSLQGAEARRRRLAGHGGI